MLKPGTPERESPFRFNIQHWLQILAGFIAHVKAIKVTHGNQASYYYYYIIIIVFMIIITNTHNEKAPHLNC